MKNLLIITVLTVILFASCTSVKIVSSPNLKAKSMKLKVINVFPILYMMKEKTEHIL